jgi:DNA-binding NarL/FixJ family response regulator
MDTNGSLRNSDEGRPRLFGILIVSHVRFLRESLAEIFARDGMGSVLGLCGDVPAALALCADLNPEIVLLDAAFPDAVAVVGRIRAAAPTTRIVALAVTEMEESVIALAEAGIAGYVPSTAALSDLSAALAGIINGGQICSARVAAGLLRRIAEAGGPKGELPAGPLLTGRERQILSMIGGGLSNKEIARQLNIGVATTKSHVHNLLGKLNIQRRGQAAAWLRQHGRQHGPL